MEKKLEADVVFSCGEDNYLPDADVWLVIDVLRATTVMTRWFELGGIELYPVKTPDDARALVQELRARGSSPLLMGEVNGLPPEGFDLGNSPVELNYELIQEHYCGVMSTTNGTVALCQAASSGRPVLAASLRNYAACLDYAMTLGKRIGLLCSGRKRWPSWEDTLCAGAIVDELGTKGEVYMTDSARIALTMWQNRGSNLVECVKKSNHALYLGQIGFDEDIKFCCECDASTVVPMLTAEEGRNILRSVSGSARPYPRVREAIAPEARITPPETLKKPDPFEELLGYTRKKDDR
ncbi:MAG: 2-phosphosulfolactate phosphatase [Synergistaceae bacterium]|nr:2-phosphosulfolactate phosphatase [Synergistaceae bacterium]